MDIKVADFILHEEADVTYGIGEVQWFDDHYVLIACERTKFSAFCYLRLIPKTFVCATGSREQVKQLHKRISQMARKRHETMRKAEEDSIALAGEMAGELRKEIKAFQYGSD